MIKYHDDMTGEELRQFMEQEKALDDAYSDAYAEEFMNPFYHLALAIWLECQWHEDWMINAEFDDIAYDNETYRRYFYEDMADRFDPVRDGWVDHKGRP